MFTLHVAFALVYDECVTAAAPVFVAYDAYTFDRAVAFEFAAEVGFGCAFVLLKMRLLVGRGEGEMGDRRTNRAMKSVL